MANSKRHGPASTLPVRRCSSLHAPLHQVLHMPCNASSCRILLLVPGAALLCSCLYFDRIDYPDDWGKESGALLANGCPDLSGTYATRPAQAHPADLPAAPMLHEILGAGGLSAVSRGDRPWPELAAATTASFQPEGDWLHLRFSDDAGHTAELHFKRKHWWGGLTEGADAMYQCLQLERGVVLGIDGARRPAFQLPYPYHPDDVATVFLSRELDGSLTVNYRTLSLGIERSLIGSHAGWVGGIWWRYPPVRHR